MGDVLQFKQAPINAALVAFKFSRMERSNRIAKTLWDLAQDKGVGFTDAEGAPITAWEQLTALAQELEPYALKDFAVRYGHLGDGHAQP